MLRIERSFFCRGTRIPLQPISHHRVPHLFPASAFAAAETIVTFGLLALILGGGAFNVATGKVPLPF
jgi:hypothetical protein